MKSKKEIFESTVKNTRFEQLSASSDIGQGIIMGYTQCQEDMKPLLKDLFSLWETLGKCGEISVGVDFTKHYERLKNSLNKQD